MASLNPSNQSLTCGLCNLSFTNEQHFMIHLDGILHQKMLKERRCQQQQSAVHSIDKQMKTEFDSSSVCIPGLGDFEDIPVERPTGGNARFVAGLRSCLKKPTSLVASSVANTSTVPDPSSVLSALNLNISAETGNILSIIKSILANNSSNSSSHSSNSSYSQLQTGPSKNTQNYGRSQRLRFSENNCSKSVCNSLETAAPSQCNDNSKGISMVLNLLGIQKDLQKNVSFDDSAPKLPSKAEAKSSIQTLLSAQFDLLKSYMVESLDSSTSHQHHFTEDKDEQSLPQESPCLGSRNAIKNKSLLRQPPLSQSSEYETGWCYSGSMQSNAESIYQSAASDTKQLPSKPDAQNIWSRNAECFRNQNLAWKSSRDSRQNVGLLRNLPVQTALRPALLPAPPDDRLSAIPRLLDCHPPVASGGFSADLHLNLTPDRPRPPLLAPTAEFRSVIGLSTKPVDASRSVGCSMDDFVSRMRHNLQRGLTSFSPITSGFSKRENFSTATASPAQLTVPTKKVLLKTPQESSDMRKTLLPLPPDSSDVHSVALPGKSSVVKLWHHEPLNSSFADRNKKLGKDVCSSPLLPLPTVDARPKHSLEPRLILSQSQNRFRGSSTFSEGFGVSTMVGRMPVSASVLPGPVMVGNSVMSSESLKREISEVPVTTSNAVVPLMSVKAVCSITKPSIVSSTHATISSGSYSSNMNENLLEAVKRAKMCSNQTDPDLKVQQETETISQEQITHLKDLNPESSVCSISKREFPMLLLDTILDSTPKEMPADAVNESGRSANLTLFNANSVSYSKINTKDDELSNTEEREISIKNLPAENMIQCMSTPVRDVSKTLGLANAEQSDPQLKLQQEIESIMKTRLIDLKEALPESMVSSINEGKIPLEFLDKISDFIPEEIIEEAIREMEKSANMTSDINRDNVCQMQTVESQLAEMGESETKNSTVHHLSEHMLEIEATENMRTEAGVEDQKESKLELVKKVIETILANLIVKHESPVNTHALENLDVADQKIALKMQQETGISDSVVIVQILNFFKALDDDHLVSLANTYSRSADGNGSMLRQMVEMVLQNRLETKLSEDQKKGQVTGDSQCKTLVRDDKQENSSGSVKSEIVIDTVSNSSSDKTVVCDTNNICSREISFCTPMPSHDSKVLDLCVEAPCQMAETPELGLNNKECLETETSTSALDASVITGPTNEDPINRTRKIMKLENDDSISSSLKPSCSKHEHTGEQMPVSDVHNKVFIISNSVAMNLAEKLTCNSELPDSHLKINLPSKASESGGLCKDLAAENELPGTVKPSEPPSSVDRIPGEASLTTVAAVAAVVATDAEFQLNVDKDVHDSCLEMVETSESSDVDLSADKMNRSKEDSTGERNETSVLNSSNPVEGISCAQSKTTSINVSSVDNLLSKQKSPGVELSKPKKTLLPTPCVSSSAAGHGVQSLLQISSRLQSPVHSSTPAVTSHAVPKPPHLLIRQRAPSKPTSVVASPPLNNVKPLIPLPRNRPVSHFQCSPKKPLLSVPPEVPSLLNMPPEVPLLPKVTPEVPSLFCRTPLLQIPPRDAGPRPLPLMSMCRHPLLPTPDPSFSKPRNLGFLPRARFPQPLKRQSSHLLMSEFEVPLFKRPR